MTKQEKIKEAYGEYSDIALELCDENGWIKDFYYLTYFPQNNESKRIGCYDCIRPISLQGIEDNNGWTKIESENDLPKKSGMYKIVRSCGYETGRYVGKDRWFCDGRDFPNYTKTHGITHWKPIEIEKMPLH